MNAKPSHSMTPLADQLDRRHQRRLAGLRACGRKFAFLVAVLGGCPTGQEPDPAQLAEGLRRVSAWTGRRMTPRDLEQGLGWLRLARVVGFFTYATRWLRPRRKTDR